MKQKDIALIIVIVFVSALISWFVSKQLFAPPEKRQQEVEVVEPITADFPKADKHFFNNSSFDPTQLITIGKNANSNPFRGKP
jgi:hypothetical protein